MSDERRSWLRFRWDAVTFIVLLAIFLVRATELAIDVMPGVPPDERVHVERCALYAATWGLPSDGAETRSIGPIEHHPYLYYLLMGRLLPLNPLPNQLLFLRLVNVIFGALTVAVAWRWLMLFTNHAGARILAIVMLTSTLMFRGMSSAVSYDALTNLLAAAAIFCATRYGVRQQPADLVGLALAALAGCLVKQTFLPLAALLLGILLWHERRALPALLSAPFRGSASSPLRFACLLATGILLLLNGILYGGNLIRFGALLPPEVWELSNAEFAAMPIDGCTRVRPAAAPLCVTRLYRSGRIGLEEAFRLANAIPDPLSRRDTLILVRRHATREAKGAEFSPISRLEYAYDWSRGMVNRSHGYLGHRVVGRSRTDIARYFLVFLGAAVGFVRRWQPTDRLGTDAFVLVAGYALFLMQVVNYTDYVLWEEIYMNVQGRYIFPVIVPLYGLIARSLLVGWPIALQVPVFLATATWMLFADLFFYLDKVAPSIVGG